MDDAPKRPQNTQEFVAMWHAVTEEAMVHQLTAALRRLTRRMPASVPQLEGEQVSGLSPILIRALQVAASPHGGVHAAVQFLAELSADEPGEGMPGASRE